MSPGNDVPFTLRVEDLEKGKERTKLDLPTDHFAAQPTIVKKVAGKTDFYSTGNNLL